MRRGYFHWVGTSTGGSSGPLGIIRSVLKKFITYCYDLNWQFLNNVIINKAKVLPQRHR
jgi:hypothetical protein